MDVQELKLDLGQGILHLTLDVPAKKNALTDTLRAELRTALLDAREDAAVRAIVISGAGGSFCSGGDISAMTGDPDIARKRMTILHDIVRALVGGAKPSVAAVAGPAFGAGFSLAMCCDQVIADDSARFCASFGRIGLPPDLGLSWTLPRRIGVSAASRILLSGRVVMAAEAEALKLVDLRVSPDALIEAARERALELAANTQDCKRHVKALLMAYGGSLEDLLEREMASYVTLLNSDEHRAARDAFMNKTGSRDGK